MSTARVLQFKVGDTHTSGEKIEFIYGHSADVIVFKDGRGHVQWETNADFLTRTQSVVHHLYDRLQARAYSCLPDGKKRQQLVDELAQALFLGLSEADETKALKYFDNTVGRIAHEAQIEGRFVYLIAGSVTAGTILVVGLVAGQFAPVDARMVIVAASAASMGAWASILSRASRLELGPFETPANLRFQGVTRILLGTMFGIVAFVAMKTGQLVPSANTSAWASALTTFVAGWSERLVPEIISKVETRSASAAAFSSKRGTA